MYCSLTFIQPNFFPHFPHGFIFPSLSPLSVSLPPHKSSLHTSNTVAILDLSVIRSPSVVQRECCGLWSPAGFAPHTGPRKLFKIHCRCRRRPFYSLKYLARTRHIANIASIKEWPLFRRSHSKSVPWQLGVVRCWRPKSSFFKVY